MPVSSQPIDLSSLEAPGSSSGATAPHPPSPPSVVHPGQVPRGAPASIYFKTGLAHLEQNQLPDALSCLDEAFLALAKDQSHGANIKAQATICAQYKIAVTILQVMGYLLSSSPQVISGAISALSLLIDNDARFCIAVPNLIASVLTLLQNKAAEVIRDEDEKESAIT